MIKRLGQLSPQLYKKTVLPIFLLSLIAFIFPGNFTFLEKVAYAFAANVFYHYGYLFGLMPRLALFLTDGQPLARIRFFMLKVWAYALFASSFFIFGGLIYTFFVCPDERIIIVCILSPLGLTYGMANLINHLADKEETVSW